MNGFVFEEVGVVAKFVERFPHLGIFASFTGFGAAVLSALKIITLVFGAAGAIFGAIAGYYTMRVWRRKWLRAQLAEDKEYVPPTSPG